LKFSRGSGGVTPRAGGRQRDILGAPAFFEEKLDFVVANIHGVFTGAWDQLHRRALPAEEAHWVVAVVPVPFTNRTNSEVTTPHQETRATAAGCSLCPESEVLEP